jgi:hypothetical protein
MCRSVVKRGVVMFGFSGSIGLILTSFRGIGITAFPVPLEGVSDRETNHFLAQCHSLKIDRRREGRRGPYYQLLGE